MKNPDNVVPFPMRKLSEEKAVQALPALSTSEILVKNREGRLAQIVHVAECFPPEGVEKKGRPVLFAPGFTEGPMTLKGNLEHLAALGRETLTYGASEGISENASIYGAYLERIPDIGAKAFRKESGYLYEVRKAVALLQVVEQKNFQTSIDAIGHSEGCIYLILAALARPEKFHTLLLVNPGGMVGEDTFIALVGRAFQHIAQERYAGILDADLRNKVKEAKSERTHNFLQNIEEGGMSPRAIAVAQIETLLLYLKQEHRIHIVIAHSVDDVIFPMGKVQEASKNTKRDPKRKQRRKGEVEVLTQEEESGVKIDGFYSIRGGHNDFFLNPEVHGLLADHAFSAIEAKEGREMGVGAFPGEVLRKVA